MASRTWPIPVTGSVGISLRVPKKSDPQSEGWPEVPVEEVAMVSSPRFISVGWAIRLARRHAQNGGHSISRFGGRIGQCLSRVDKESPASWGTEVPFRSE